MTILKIENRVVKGKMTEMCLLKCDGMPSKSWWASRASADKLEVMFAGKHYCNDHIVMMDVSNSPELPTKFKSQFVKTGV
jgi:hypothetical protein